MEDSHQIGGEADVAVVDEHHEKVEGRLTPRIDALRITPGIEDNLNKLGTAGNCCCMQASFSILKIQTFAIKTWA